MSKETTPWWSPRPCDPEDHEYGWRYDLTWDHTGDAYEQFEALADSHADLLHFVEMVRDAARDALADDVMVEWAAETARRADALLAKSRGEEATA